MCSRLTYHILFGTTLCWLHYEEPGEAVKLDPNLSALRRSNRPSLALSPPPLARALHSAPRSLRFRTCSFGVAEHVKELIQSWTVRGLKLLNRNGFRDLVAMTPCSSCGGAGNSSPMKRDRILLRGMLFHGYHGVLAEENKLGQKFLVDVDAWMDLRSAGRSDDIGQSVSYAELYEQIKAVVEGPPSKLVENVADNIAEAIVFAHPAITDVRVKVCKPHVAVAGVLDHLGVEIFRNAEDYFRPHGKRRVGPSVQKLRERSTLFKESLDRFASS